MSPARFHCAKSLFDIRKFLFAKSKPHHFDRDSSAGPENVEEQFKARRMMLRHQFYTYKMLRL
jgi:hypothetical protein